MDRETRRIALYLGVLVALIAIGIYSMALMQADTAGPVTAKSSSSSGAGTR
jgi:hypothetical protein